MISNPYMNLCLPFEKRSGLSAAISTLWLFPSRMSSAIASPVAGALRMPQHE